jgi:hypothetical protein
MERIDGKTEVVGSDAVGAAEEVEASTAVVQVRREIEIAVVGIRTRLYRKVAIAAGLFVGKFN